MSASDVAACSELYRSCIEHLRCPTQRVLVADPLNAYSTSEPSSATSFAPRSHVTLEQLVLGSN